MTIDREPKISVVVPSYNYGAFIEQTISSVLAQTFGDLEVIVVDDGSTDQTAVVVDRFHDKRLRYIYQDNRGLPAARNTGIRAARAPIIALLDADDLYHPEKLAIATAYLDNHPEVGLLYNGRTTITTEGEPILMHRAPQTVTLSDLVLGYPFAPSDVVVRREWAEKVDLFDERRVPNGEDLDFHLRLFLQGCQFAGLPRSLNYRRMHAKRRFSNIDRKLVTHIWALDTAFEHPKCPPEVMDMRPVAYSNQYLVHAFWALTQSDKDRGLEYLAEAKSGNSQFASDEHLAQQILWMSVEEGGDHKESIETIIEQLPAAFYGLTRRLTDWAIPQGYLLRASLHMLWGREEVAMTMYLKVDTASRVLDARYFGLLMEQLSLMRLNLGDANSLVARERLVRFLSELTTRETLRTFISSLDFQLAFEQYSQSRYGATLESLWSAAKNDLRLTINRGAWALSVKSIGGLLGR